MTSCSMCHCDLLPNGRCPHCDFPCAACRTDRAGNWRYCDSAQNAQIYQGVGP